MKRPAWLALACAAVFGAPPANLAIARRVVQQLYTTGSTLPNASLSLLDGTGQPLFSRIDNVQVSVEGAAPSLYDVPLVAFELRLDLSAVDINVIQLGQSGVLNPQVAPQGRKVWIVVEGVGR